MNRKNLVFTIVILLGLALVSTFKMIVEKTPVSAAMTADETVAAAPATSLPNTVTGNTLETVKKRGKLICGGSGQLVGFGYLDPHTGQFSGFDIDFCRTVAAAVLGDANALEILPLDATNRFPVLQSGQIDVLIRNTTWTLGRDTSLGFNFAPTTFYDGQGMMVRQKSGIKKLKDLSGATICVQQGTTTEKNLAEVMQMLGVQYEPVVFADAVDSRIAYDEGRCDAFTTDKSTLVVEQTRLKSPDEHIILAETMSKEPLGPVVRHGDDQWFDIVKWVVFGTFAAEEYGVTSKNVEELAATSEDPVIRNLLGVEGNLGLGLGLDNSFMVNVIKQVGNYGEIYDRNLGPNTPFKLARGLNAQWTDGGLIYAPPFR